MKELFRVLAESSMAGVCLIQEDRFQYANPAMTRMFGHTLEALRAGISPVDLVPAADRTAFAASVLRPLAGEGKEVRCRFRGLRKDGSSFPAELLARKVQWDGGAGLAATFIDGGGDCRALDELRASESRLRGFVDDAMDAFFVLDRKGFVRDVNRQACLSLGYSREELVGMHVRAFDAALDEDSLERIRRQTRAGAPMTFETLHRSKDGAVFPVEVRTGGFLQDGGHSLSMARDITERKRAEQELRASEQRFRTFVDQATDAFFLLDADLTVLDVNRQACISLGYSREELIGMRPRDFDAALDEAAIERMRRRIATGETVSFETVHRRRDGTVFPVEIRAVQFDQGGRRHLTLVRDISERKQAEQALREREIKIQRLIDADIIGIFMWRRDGRILEANDAFLRIVGYSREDLVAGLSFRDMTPSDWIDECEKIWYPQLRRIGSARYEKEYFRKDGSRVRVLIGDATFEIGGQEGVAFVLDLSERQRAEEALRQMQAQLAHANRLETMGQLTASIAHEVNHPIAATLANAQAALRWLQAERPDLDEARDALRRIVRDADRAGKVVSRVRDLFKKAPPAREATDVNAVILEVLEFARSETVKNEVTVRTDIAADLPLVQADRVALQQVVLNLIVNAVEAIKEGEGARELVLSTRTEAREVLVAVADSGPGLAPFVRENLFKAFATTKPNGLGLGLSICRSIVEEHGGRLWAGANSPRGAVFQFTLPPKNYEAKQKETS